MYDDLIGSQAKLAGALQDELLEKLHGDSPLVVDLRDYSHVLAQTIDKLVTLDRARAGYGEA